MSKPNMIKRADGSYSKHGLWDSIRENKGSGKAPTKEMLKQEKKIKAKYDEGGITGKPNKIKLNTNIITNKQDNTVNNSPQLRQKNQNWANQSLTNGSFNPNKMYAKGNVEEATLDAMAALDLPFALGKGLVRGITSGAIKNSLRELGNQYAPNLYKTEQLANIKKGEEFFTNWMNNPNTIKRLKSNDLEKRVLNNRYGNSNIPSRGTKLQDMNNTVNNGESLVYFSPYKDMYKELHGKEMPFSHKIEPGFRTLQGFNDPNLIKPIVGNNVKLNKTAGTTVHELTHRYAQPDYGPTSRMFDDMEHGFSTPSHFTEHQKYLSQGNEVHARVMELRQHYKMDPNNHYVNDYMLDNIIKDGLAGKTPIQSDFFKIAKNNRGKLKNAFNYAPVAAGVAGITNETMKTNKYNNGGTIHIKPENKGKFNATKKATGKTTEELTHSKNPVTKKRAIFAQNAAKWKHEEGGEIEKLGTDNTNVNIPKKDLTISRFKTGSKNYNEIPEAFRNLPLQTGKVDDASLDAVQALTGIGALARAGKIGYGAYQLAKPNIINLSKTYRPTYSNALRQAGQALLPFAGGGTSSKRVPIKVTDPNDPRLRAFNDSNSLYNKGIENEKFYIEHGMTKDKTHEFPFSRVTSYAYATKPKGKIQPISAISQELNPNHPDYYRAQFLKYKKPVQPYVYEKSIQETTPIVQQPIVNKPIEQVKPQYTSQKQMYQGREFMDSTQLQPNWYHPEEITERMKDPNRKFDKGGRVLPKYAEAGWLTKNKTGVGAGLGFAGDTTNLLFDNNVFGTRNKVTDSEGNELGEAQSDAGSQTQGALSGALKGASAGAVLGPWGYAGGALVGGTVGFLTADTGAEDKLNQIKRERNAQISFKNMLGKGPIENNSIQTNSLALSAYGGYINKKYANGGMKTLNQNHPEATEEVELGESAMLPNGMNLAFGGETHENGGLETNLPEGTRIFSDRIKSGKRTIASIAKPIQNKIEKLKDNNSKAGQNTIKLFENQLDNLFNEQEEIKQQQDMAQQRKYFAKGGLKNKKSYRYQPPEAEAMENENDLSELNNIYVKGDANTQTGKNYNDYTDEELFGTSPVVTPLMTDYKGTYGNTRPIDTSEPRFNKGDIGTAGALGTSLLGNLIQRNNLNKVAPPRTLVAPTFTAGRTPVKADYSADLQSADNQFNAARRGVMMNSGNYSTQAGNLGQLRAEQLRNRSKILQNQNNANAVLMNEYQKAQADAINKNALSNYTTDQENMENLYNYNLWKTGQTNAADASAFNTSGQMFNNMVTGQNQLDAAEMYRRMYAQKVQDDLAFKAMGGTVRNYFAKGGTVYRKALENLPSVDKAAQMDAEYASHLDAKGQPLQDTFKSKVTGLEYKVLPRKEKDLYAANLWKDVHNSAPTKSQVAATTKALDGKKTSSPGAKTVADTHNSQVPQLEVTLPEVVITGKRSLNPQQMMDNKFGKPQVSNQLPAVPSKPVPDWVNKANNAKPNFNQPNVNEPVNEKPVVNKPKLQTETPNWLKNPLQPKFNRNEVGEPDNSGSSFNPDTNESKIEKGKKYVNNVLKPAIQEGRKRLNEMDITAGAKMNMETAGKVANKIGKKMPLAAQLLSRDLFDKVRNRTITEKDLTPDQLETLKMTINGVKNKTGRDYLTYHDYDNAGGTKMGILEQARSIFENPDNANLKYSFGKAKFKQKGDSTIVEDEYNSNRLTSGNYFKDVYKGIKEGDNLGYAPIRGVLTRFGSQEGDGRGAKVRIAMHNPQKRTIKKK